MLVTVRSAPTDVSIISYRDRFDPEKGFRLGSDRDIIYTELTSSFGASPKDLLEIFPEKKRLWAIRKEIKIISTIVSNYFYLVEEFDRFFLVKK